MRKSPLNGALAVPEACSIPALHVDWLSLSQEHAECPTWGSTWRVDYDLNTGAVVQEVVKSEQLKGSWESSLVVRAAGGRVEVSGNPSKWGRLESVGLGCRSVFEAVNVYNRVLSGLGLPLFTYPERIRVTGQGGAIDRTVRQGPRISWIHIASLVILGSADALPHYFNWLSTQRVGRRGHLMEPKGPLSVRAGTRRRRSLAIYAKGAEVTQQLARWQRKRSGVVDELDEARRFLSILAERCESLGICRREVRLSGDYLATKGLQWAEEWSQNTMKDEWSEYSVSDEEVGAMIDWKAEGLQRLIARGLSERTARQRLEVLHAWMNGDDVGPGPGRSKPTFYRIAADLREIFGVDIRNRPNVIAISSRLSPMVRPVHARVATLADVEALYQGLDVLPKVA